ncbi:hypothetical protein QUF70_05350 [Desulfobacterales bacterium HSG17]|nr:hypothetical protein [Desulfobacterales bacterium HSG17]
MAYIYLLNLHEIIDKKINEVKKGIANTSNDPWRIKFLEGRIQALTELKIFLTNNLNSKFPRKIRKRFKEKQ